MIRKLAWVGKMAAVVGISVLAFACSDSDEETPSTIDAGGDVAVECELLEDGTCSAGCSPQKGFPYDEEGECLLPEKVMSCADQPGGDDAEGCYVDLETGTKYWTPQLYTSEGMSRFRTCTAEEAGEIDPAMRCE